MDEKTLLEKWLSNSLSEAEKEAFESSDAFPFYKQLVSDATQFKASHFSHVSDYESLRKRLPEKETPVRKLNPTSWFLRIASVFVIGFALYYFFLVPSEVRVETLTAQKTTIELPDASQVVLNAMSEVAYDRRKWKEERSLDLKGEAFFDVVKGSRFDVVTSMGTVSVLGTEFNVKQRHSLFEVICYEGIVKVVSGEHTQELRAGDRLKLEDGQMVLGRTLSEGPEWRQNISDFTETPLSEVIDELERQYGVEVELIDLNENTLFTGGFVHGDLQHAIRSIAEPLNLDFQIKDKTTVILRTREH